MHGYNHEDEGHC